MSDETAKHTPERIKQIIADLTNGVGEKPYCRRVDGQMVVFVADDQEYCRIAEIDDFDEQVAQSICEAGLLIDTLRRQRDMLLDACKLSEFILSAVELTYPGIFKTDEPISACRAALAEEKKQ